MLQTVAPNEEFNFNPTLHYTHDDYDIAILELRERIDEIKYPPPLTSFSKMQFPFEVHLIGHPGGVQMMEDSEVYPGIISDSYWDERITELSQWSLRNCPDTEHTANRDYYAALRHPPRKILFHTTFCQGSSGSPGVMIKNGKSFAVLIVVGGVPKCHYDGIAKVEPKNRVEYGYAVEDICGEMKRSAHGNIKVLAKQIFGELYDKI